MTGLNRKSTDFSEEEKSSILVQFKASGLDQVSFAREHNINPGTLRNWVFWHSGDRTIKRFTPVERKKIVEAYLQSGIALPQFAEAWGVGNSTLQKWITRYELYGSDGLMNGGAKAGDSPGMEVLPTCSKPVTRS